MDEAAEGSGQDGRKITALVVRYLDGRPAVIDADSDDICPIYDGDTASDAVAWLIAELGFIRWCTRAEAVAELVMVTVPIPDDPGDLEANLQVAAWTPQVSYGFVRNGELYAKAG